MAKAKLPASTPAFTAADAPVEDRMHWVKVPFAEIKALYDDGVLKIQRNHLRRLHFAEHILRTNLPMHANFMALRFADGSAQLVDGYTRIAAIISGQKEEPAHAWLGVIDVDSQKQAEQYYLAIDSRKAVKTGRDAFEEGLRKAGLLDKMISPVFINGYAVSALYAASGESDTRTAVGKFKKAIERLDPLHLEVGRFALPAGALGGCLLLAQHETDTTAVQQFTAAVSRLDKLSTDDRKLVPGALKFATWLHERREQGALSGKNVPTILAQAIGSFLWQQGGATGRIEPLARDEYLKQI